MIDYDYKPQGVCARAIHVELDDAGMTIERVSFEGGCNGNLKAISKLVAGMPVAQVVDTLAGNTCGKRPTSCADQLAHALTEATAQTAARTSRASQVPAAPAGA